MRNTIHILTLDIIPVALASIYGGAVEASRRFMVSGGVSPEEYEELAGYIVTLLGDKGMTAQEIRKALGRDRNISAVISLMCDRAVAVRGRPAGSRRSNNHRYALFEDYFPRVEPWGMGEREAVGALVERYGRTYGPVSVTDIARWTGLGKARAGGGAKGLEGGRGGGSRPGDQGQPGHLGLRQGAAG